LWRQSARWIDLVVRMAEAALDLGAQRRLAIAALTRPAEEQDDPPGSKKRSASSIAVSGSAEPTWPSAATPASRSAATLSCSTTCARSLAASVSDTHERGQPERRVTAAPGAAGGRGESPADEAEASCPERQSGSAIGRQAGVGAGVAAPLRLVQP
jgi:hypothetical protein